MAEHALCAPGPRVTGLLGQLPAILAFRRAQQTFKVPPRLPPRLGPAEQPTEPLLQRSQLIPPNEDARRFCVSDGRWPPTAHFPDRGWCRLRSGLRECPLRGQVDTYLAEGDAGEHGGSSGGSDGSGVSERRS